MVSGVLRVGAGVILGYPRVRILSGIRLRLRDATGGGLEALFEGMKRQDCD